MMYWKVLIYYLYKILKFLENYFLFMFMYVIFIHHSLYSISELTENIEKHEL